ncbi:MAG: sensor histidine kinase [Algicola sp.]|nr:sensor histidine kinase [Algicola sp.]
MKAAISNYCIQPFLLLGLLFSLDLHGATYQLTPQAEGADISSYVSYVYSPAAGPAELMAKQPEFNPVSSVRATLLPAKIWYQLTLSNTGDQAVDRYLLTHFPNMPLLRAYAQNEQNQWRQIYDNSGSFNNRPLKHPLETIPITIPPQTQQTILIEYYGLSNVQLFFELYDEQHIVEQKLWHIIVNAVLIIIMIAIALFSLLQYFFTPNTRLLSYALLAVASALFTSEASGFNFQLLWPDKPALNEYAPLFLSTFLFYAYLTFTMKLFDLRKRSTLIYKIYQYLRITLLALLVCNVFVNTLHVMIALVVVFSPLPIITGLWAIKHKLWAARFFLVGAVLNIVLSQLIFMLGSMGILFTRKIHIITFSKAGLAIELLLFAVALIYQGRLITNKLEHSQRQRIVETQSLLKIEQEKNDIMHASQQKLLSLSMIAHDLLQPLSSIRFALAAIDEDKSAEAKKVIASTVKFSDDLMRTIISDLRAQYRASERDMTVTVSQLLTQITATTALQAKHHQITVRHYGSPRNIQVLPIVTHRILVNLIENAMRYAKGRDILVGQRLTGSGIKLCVYDCGNGIPQSVLTQLERPFKKLDVFDENSQGFGLGLYIVKSLCDQANYTFSVSSTLNKGSCFAIEVPLSQ